MLFFRVGSFGHFTLKKRELFDKKRNSRIIRSLLRSVLQNNRGLAQEGPLPSNFTQFRSCSLCLCTFYSIWLHEKLQKEGDGRLEHFCWNMHDHVMNCKCCNLCNSSQLGGSRDCLEMTVKRKLNFVNHGTYVIPRLSRGRWGRKGDKLVEMGVRGIKFPNATF